MSEKILEKEVIMEDFNMNLYNSVRKVEKEALKKINGGRINGFDSINPMWRIEMLTKHFGHCGKGWYYNITKMWKEESCNDEVFVFLTIDLFVNIAGEWSAPIQGLGGSKLITKEKNGLYGSDECYKMALTDALSVACKALGFGADIYFKEGADKYNREEKDSDDYKQRMYDIRMELTEYFFDCDERIKENIYSAFKKDRDSDITDFNNDEIIAIYERLKNKGFIK